MGSALPALAGHEARRVIAAAALMTSDKDGEVLAAVRAACRLLAPHNLAPADVFRAALEGEGDRRSGNSDGGPCGAWPITWQRQARMARACAALNDWERAFLGSIMEQRTLSKKQRDLLEEIIAKAERSRAW